MSARNKRARTNAKKELSGYLNRPNDTAIPTTHYKAPIMEIGYPRLHACKLDYVDWEPYSNGKVLSIGKCKLKKAA